MNITRNVVSERERALLSGDYAAYHTQASRRIHTLRKRLRVTTPKGRKYSPKDPVTTENVAANAEYVHLSAASSPDVLLGGFSCCWRAPREHGRVPWP